MLFILFVLVVVVVVVVSLYVVVVVVVQDLDNVFAYIYVCKITVVPTQYYCKGYSKHNFLMSLKTISGTNKKTSESI